MSVDSREKGKRFERELAKILSSYGYECRRTNQYCGNTGDASDVVGLPYIHVEAKHQERMMLYDWIAQAVRDAKGNGRIPAVFHKKNNAHILVSMELKDWIELYKAYERAKRDER